MYNYVTAFFFFLHNYYHHAKYLSVYKLLPLVDQRHVPAQFDDHDACLFVCLFVLIRRSAAGGFGTQRNGFSKLIKISCSTSFIVLLLSRRSLIFLLEFSEESWVR